MRISVPGGVGVGDANASERCSRELDRFCIVLAVKQRVCDIAVTVRPAVDCNGRDVARAIKSSRTKHTIELVSDSFLELRESRVQEFRGPDSELGARVEPRIGGARNVYQMQHDRLTGIARMFVSAKTHRKVESDVA